jgi:hypothetical protein
MSDAARGSKKRTAEEMDAYRAKRTAQRREQRRRKRAKQQEEERKEVEEGRRVVDPNMRADLRKAINDLIAELVGIGKNPEKLVSPEVGIRVIDELSSVRLRKSQYSTCEQLKQTILLAVKKVKEKNPKFKGPTAKSLNSYHSRLKTIYNHHFGKSQRTHDFDCTNFEWLQGDKLNGVIDTIKKKYKTVDSQISMLTALLAITKWLVEYQDVHDAVKTYIEGLEPRQTGSGVLSPKEEKAYKSYEEVLSQYNKKYKQSDRRDSDVKKARTRLLLSLYILQPPRRLDYRLMRVVQKDSQELNNTDFNYLVMNKGSGQNFGAPYEFVFNEYKTKRKFGKQTFRITTPRLKSEILRYVNQLNLENNALLFPAKQNRTGESVANTQGNFSKLVNQAFRFLGLPDGFTANTMRHSYASWFVEQSGNITKANLADVGKKMGHGVGMFLEYVRKENSGAKEKINGIRLTEEEEQAAAEEILLEAGDENNEA